MENSPNCRESVETRIGAMTIKPCCIITLSISLYHTYPHPHPLPILTYVSEVTQLLNGCV